MIFIHILLLVAGALPFIVFVVKRKNYRAILKNGVEINAVVTEVRRVRFNRGATIEKVSFAYLPASASQYFYGQLTSSKVGQYKKGDQLPVFFLPLNPQKNAVPGSKGEIVFLIFTLLFFLLMIFACTKIHDTVKAENTTYEFKPPWKK